MLCAQVNYENSFAKLQRYPEGWGGGDSTNATNLSLFYPYQHLLYTHTQPRTKCDNSCTHYSSLSAFVFALLTVAVLLPMTEPYTKWVPYSMFYEERGILDRLVEPARLPVQFSLVPVLCICDGFWHFPRVSVPYGNVVWLPWAHKREILHHNAHFILPTSYQGEFSLSKHSVSTNQNQSQERSKLYLFLWGCVRSDLGMPRVCVRTSYV